MAELVTPKIECSEASGNYGRFVAEPLDMGFGITIGNALRRVLLSSLTGAAITRVKVEGVEHEFTTVPHMKEDVTEFMLNVKAIRLRSLSQHPGRMALEVEGEGEVTGADIKPSADFEVVNPELHLATLDSADAKLYVEFNVDLGRGYQPAGHSDGLPAGEILVDAIFTPVRQVNYRVEPTRIGKESSYERLVLEVWTDGTLAAEEAVSQSADILIQQLSLFKDLVKVVQKSAERQAIRLNITEEQYNMPVEQLSLSVRTLNCLKRGNISLVGQLLEKTDEELMGLRSFGRKSLMEVKAKLQELGLIEAPPEAEATTEGTEPAEAKEEESSEADEDSEETDKEQKP